MSDWKRIESGKDVDAVLGTCICCGKTGQVAATLFDYEGENPIQMCAVCYELAEDLSPDDVEDLENK